jgi:hypothetical protein
MIHSGWCGNSTDYCSVSAGCQSSYGICDAAVNSTATSGGGTPGTSTNGQCGPSLGTCASKECCSLAGFCGVTEGMDIYLTHRNSAHDIQNTVRLPIASLIMVRRVMPTKSPQEPTLLQSLETNSDLFSTDLPEFMIALKQEIWRSHLTMVPSFTQAIF